MLERALDVGPPVVAFRGEVAGFLAIRRRQLPATWNGQPGCLPSRFVPPAGISRIAGFSLGIHQATLAAHCQSATASVLFVWGNGWCSESRRPSACAASP